MKKIHFISAGFLGFLTPVLAFAQNDGTNQLSLLISGLASLVNAIVPILITVAIAYFIYGVIKYVISQDEDDKAKARTTIIQGLIGVFVIVSIWGIISLLQNTLLDTDTLGSQEVDIIPVVN